ncbi:MAG: Calx-beta domain-containing protein, partial [Limisphaerales bacterium]
MKKLTSVLILAGGLLTGLTVHATPFASCISNINNNVYFNLNEPGGTVTVTYENGTTNANFNGSTTGLNLPAGYQHFDFTGHTSYNISVYKAGNGIPTVVTNIARGAARGIAANVRGNSPYFGYVYSEIGGGGVVMMRSDGSSPVPGAALKPTANNFTWSGNYQEYFISIAPDDSVIISDFTSPSQGGVIWANPQMTTANLILQNDAGLISGDTADFNHGDAESRAILTAGLGNNPTLWVIDGSYGNGSSIPYNTIMAYHLGTANFANGTLPWLGQPDIIGASVNPSNLAGGGSTGFFRDGFAIGTNGYIYLTVDRNNLSNPNLQVYASDATTLLWSSFFTNSQGQLKDYLITGTQQLPESGLAAAEMALSPDNRYIACIHDDNHVTIFSMTNGIPDVSTEYLISWTNSTSTTTAGRYVCWDAAGNLWVASPGLAVVDQITTGRTGTAITSGNASGPTSFQVLTPTEIDITSVQALAPQANSYPNYPIASTNTITRNGNISSPLSVPFTMSGTAPNGTYIVSVTNSINFAAGQSSTNVVVTAVTDGIPRPTTTAVMTLVDNGSGQYIVGFQNQATTFIVNTATPQLTVANAATSMYKAYSNDYASISVTRIGDTNVAVTSAAFTYGGAAVRNTDFASISTTVAFAKGDLTKTVKIAKPLVNGQIPVHTSNPIYTGDKTFTVTIPSGTGYNTYSSNNVATLKIIDNAYPTASVLYANPLTDPNDSANWNITALV